MALHKISPNQLAATTQKSSILADIELLSQRVSKALQGNTKFLDANQKQVTAALKRLTEAHGLLSTGLIPTNQE